MKETMVEGAPATLIRPDTPADRYTRPGQHLFATRCRPYACAACALFVQRSVLRPKQEQQQQWP